MENDKQRLIIVSNRAPMSVYEAADGQLQTRRGLGGLATAMAHVWEKPQSLWVGWSGLGRSFSEAEFESLELGHKIALINLESSLYRRYYDVFANGSLWPVFHGFKPRQMYGPEDVEAAKTVSERFARCVERVAHPDDTIWVHDFQLAWLPGILRQIGLRNRLGFFLHIPFPEPDQFRLLPDHREIALSLVSCNLVGFQTERDVERFKRYAAEEGVDLDQTMVQAFPIGIDYELYARTPERPEAQLQLADIEERYRGKKVLFSVSRLDYTKGILHQLRAVDELLAANPRSDLVYKLVVAPSREDLHEYQAVRRQTGDLAADINRRHGTDDWQPVEYDYRSYDMDELAAWYRRADVMLVTPLIDGMNLIAKEYVAAARDDGVLVLGQGAGAAQQMTEAIIVDPVDVAATAAAIGQAVAMPAHERRRRMRMLRQCVKRNDVEAWASSFLRQLEVKPQSVAGVRFKV